MVRLLVTKINQAKFTRYFIEGTWLIKIIVKHVLRVYFYFVCSWHWLSIYIAFACGEMTLKLIYTTTRFHDAFPVISRSTRKPDPPEKPFEDSEQPGMRLHSSLYCVACVSKQNELVDAGTSTEDLVPKKKEFDATTAPDDCIQLPSGTVVRVSSMKLEKEEKDAYSYDSNQSGMKPQVPLPY